MTTELSKDLERTQEVLRILSKRITHLNEAFEPLERDLRTKDFAKSGVYILGTSSGVVCFPTSLSPGDPLKEGIEEAKEKGIRMPTLVEADDSEETLSTCDSIIRMLKLELWDDRKVILKPGFIIIVRWDVLLPYLEEKSTVVVGTRYISEPEGSLKKVIDKLQRLGMHVVEDSGQYGGGLMAYEFSRAFAGREKVLIVQLTLSSHAAEDKKKVVKMLEQLSTFQVHSHDRYRS
ncbi:MAG: hypothetical protein ACFFD6_06315 [Candidatus Thorarchaeota archaeon]